MRQLKLLDTFCGAGGCTKGYQNAGFYVVGVDIKPQPRYVGDEFFQGDAIEFIRRYGHEFDVVHASPPCQVYSVTASLSNGNHPDLVDETRGELLAIGKPYVIENVPGAPLINPLMLCGTMFGLQVIRHRLFETWPVIWWPPVACAHDTGGIPRAGRGISPKGFISISGHINNTDYARRAMGIDWMIGSELSQAIPPAYTEFIGRQMMEMIMEQA